MAYAPQRICGCGKKIAKGSLCPCQVQKRTQREKLRPTARQRGYNSKWEKASRTFLSRPENSRCFYCGDPATLVDHAIAHKGDQKLFWDKSNWRPCCGPCNRRKNVQSEGGFGNPIRKFGE